MGGTPFYTNKNNWLYYLMAIIHVTPLQMGTDSVFRHSFGEVTLVFGTINPPWEKDNASSCNIVDKLTLDTFRRISCYRENAMFDRLWNMENSQELYLESRIYILPELSKTVLSEWTLLLDVTRHFQPCRCRRLFPVGAAVHRRRRVLTSLHAADIYFDISKPLVLVNLHPTSTPLGLTN